MVINSLINILTIMGHKVNLFHQQNQINPSQTVYCMFQASLKNFHKISDNL